MEKNYTSADIQALAELLFEQAGGLDVTMKRIEQFRHVPSLPGAIHNYYYVNKKVFDYSDLNATLGQAVLFLAGGPRAQAAGERLITLYKALATVRYLIDYHFCDRAFDGYALSLLIHAWLHVKADARFSDICSREDAQLIEDWFYHRAKLMWQDRDAPTWASFRPYDNQEIGIGICTLLATLFEKRDPELCRGFHALSDERLVGWQRKNGNLDDTLFYTPVFTKVLWYYAVYRGREDLLSLDTCRQTFEGMLQQHSGTGIFALYNWTQPGSAADMMALGAKLFSDGRYKWLANRFIEERLKKRPGRAAFAKRHITGKQLEEAFAPETELMEVISEEISRTDRYDHVWEGLTDNVFHLWLFWDDAIEPVRPGQGSQVLYKSAGQGRWPYDPEPVLPDKVVLREGYQEQDMVVLLNLWGGQNSPSARTVSHRYPAANEIISLIKGEQFLVQNIDQVTRDILIERKWLNAFSLKREGQWLNAAISGQGVFGKYASIDMSNAHLHFFSAMKDVDGVKSTLYDYHGWTNERTALLLKDQCLAVFDQCFGPTEETGGVRWHLQGDRISSFDQGVTLNILGSELTVAWPKAEGWHRAELTANERLIPVYQHHADWDLDLMAQGRSMGFLTLFGDKAQLENARAVAVTCAGSPAHPYGIGVRMGNVLLGTRMVLYTDEYDYEGFKTDAAAFAFSDHKKQKRLTFFQARVFRIPLDAMRTLRLEPGINEEAAFEYHCGILTIHFKTPQSGSLVIV